MAIAVGMLGAVVGLVICHMVERGAQGRLLRASVLRRMVAVAACGLAFFALASTYGATLQTLELCGLATVLLTLSLTDFDRREIPNACVLAALGLRLAYLLLACARGEMSLAVLGYYLLSALGVGLALLLTVLVADWLLGGESMGGGDLKLFAVAALYVGWEQSLVLVALACVLGIAGAFVFGRRRQAVEEHGAQTSVFAFGPAISLACVIVLLCGGGAAAWEAFPLI